MTSPSEIVGAVLGSPISHSLSPALYRTAFSELNITGEYQAIDCTVSQLTHVYADLVSHGVRALSITMPLKEAIIDFLPSIDEDAQLLNAVNCVSFVDGAARGHNTDGDGCCDALEQQGGASLKDASAVVLGAGGTARSVALALGRRGVKVAVVNRTSSRADDLVDRLSHAVNTAGGSLSIGTIDDVARASLLVNATSVGMNTSETPIPTDVLHKDLVVLDAVYQPITTALLSAASSVGARTVDGLWMLIQQARRQCLHQFGARPSAEDMRQSAERELANRRK